jgi:hypothetical protein
MPKATAVWLIDKTSLSFDQIADFVGMHPLEIQAIADGEVAQGIVGFDPVASGQLTREEIARCEADPGARLKLLESTIVLPKQRSKGGRYTPVSKRNDRPDAIAWLLRYHPELPDSAIMKLVGTTKSTINSVRDRTHWNAANIKPVDPVSLGICSQLDLDFAVQKAARKAGKPATETAPVRTLIPAAEVEGTAAYAAAQAEEEQPTFAPSEPSTREAEPEYDADSVFAKLKPLKRGEPESE